MRYVILIAIALFSALITGGVSPQLAIFGAEPDLLLIVMLSMELREKTLTPAIVCSVAAIFIDAFYAPAIGYYSLPYLIIGLIVYFVFAKREVGAIIIPMIVCAASWVVKELLSAAFAFFLGNTFDFFHIFVTSTLPGIPVHAVLMIPVFLLMGLLYRSNVMIPASASMMDEFPGLVGKGRGRRL